MYRTNRGALDECVAMDRGRGLSDGRREPARRFGIRISDNLEQPCVPRSHMPALFPALAHRHARHRKIAIDTYAHEWIEGSSVSTKKPRKSTGPDSALMLREEHPPASRSQRDVCIINSVSLRSSYPETTSGWAFHRAITSHVTMLPSATCE